MLENINPHFKNAQGDTFPSAVIVIEDGHYRKEKTEVTEIYFKRTNQENYEETETTGDDSYEGLGGEVKFTAKYWTQKANYQQGKKGYWLEDSDGDIEHVIEMDEHWSDRFNAIQGTNQQKITRLCELYLTEVVLVKLRVG